MDNDSLEMNDVIEQLVSTLSVSNNSWTAWELEFIESLDGEEWEKLSFKQQEVVQNLWEKI